MISAEEKLKKLLGGFGIFIFDPDDIKDGVTSQKVSGKNSQEIDATALKDNIFILINIYNGSREQEIEDKMKKFFVNLEYFNDIGQLNLIVANDRTERGKEHKNFIDELKQEISASNYEFVVIKLVFCPNMNIPLDQIQLKPNEFIIDKRLFNYFDYILKIVGYEHAERELFYFFKIKMGLIKMQKGSRVGAEPELTQDFVAIETNLGVNQKMYSACVSVNDIIKYTQVLRIANEYDVKAFQRMVNGEVLKNISDHYLDEQKTFPNNIILALNPEIYDPGRSNHFILDHGDYKAIKFYKEFGSLIIIDGQHRLLAHLLNSSRDINNPILINAILFLDKEKAYDEMAGLFYTINTKQKRLTSLVSLKIRSKIEPDSIEGIWYNLFEKLNRLNKNDNFLYNKISFEEKELRESTNKISVASIINYSGLRRITDGGKIRGRQYVGLKHLAEISVGADCTPMDFYEHFIRKYFNIIKELLMADNLSISPRDMGGLLRLIIHFINDRRTKNLFEQLSRGDGATSEELRKNINVYFNEIPFSRLSDLDYAAQHWAAMEGFFLGCIRRKHRGFGFASLLSKKGRIALKKGKKF
jgi:DGQHR domain-containing protein